MSSIEEQMPPVIAGRESDSIPIPTKAIASALWHRRRWIASVIGIGLLVTIAIAFLLPNEYTSITHLMPPDPQLLSNSSALTALISGPTSMASGLGGGLMSTRSVGQTVIGILGSRTVQNDIMNRFDLRSEYHCKFYVDARKILAKRTALEEDKLSGIISISVTDKDRYRARDISEAYVEELNKLVNSLSTSSARRERIFLETRLNSIKANLDTSSRALSQFSSHNATFDPERQGEATVEAAISLQSELIASESELEVLRAEYADDNVRVRGARARVAELQSQLRKVSGGGRDENGGNVTIDQLLPSVRKLPLLGFTYADLDRQVMMNENLYEMLTKQYELAKVEEAKEIPIITVLDAPDLPERHSSPHRLIILLGGVLLSAFAGITWVVAVTWWGVLDDSNRIKAFGISVFSSIRGHEAGSQT